MSEAKHYNMCQECSRSSNSGKWVDYEEYQKLAERLRRAEVLLSEARIVNSAFYPDWIKKYDEYKKDYDKEEER